MFSSEFARSLCYLYFTAFDASNRYNTDEEICEVIDYLNKKAFDEITNNKPLDYRYVDLNPNYIGTAYAVLRNSYIERDMRNDSV